MQGTTEVTECKKCGAGMKLGKAIEQTSVCHDRDMGGVVTMSPGGPGKLIDCWKCPECGYSITIPALLRKQAE